MRYVPKKFKEKRELAVELESVPPNGSGEKQKKPRAPRRKPTGVKRNQRGKKPSLSEEAIRLRAYFISEERMRLGLPGDSQSDWLEARRQLLAEIGGS
jgi:hypothetical protein